MNIEQDLIDKFRTLSIDKQQQVLEFAEFLQQKSLPKRPRRSPKGLWNRLGINLTEADIDEARREMWGISVKENIETIW